MLLSRSACKRSMSCGISLMLYLLLSLYADSDSVAKIPGDWLGADLLDRALFEAIKVKLLFSYGVLLELVSVRIGHHHAYEACGISLLDMMKKHLACEAKVTTIANASEVLVLRPSLEVMGESALLVKCLETLINLLVYLLKLPIQCWWP